MTPVLVSKRHKSLIVPAAPAVRNFFPDAPVITHKGNDMVVVPHLPSETFILRKMGFECSAPILEQYDWPGVHRPFDVQKKTCALMTMNERAYVLNSMGTGKTRAACWSFDFLKQNGLATKALVVAPLSTLTFTWAKEIFTTIPHVRYAVLHGTRERRLERLADPDVDIFIINHDGIKVIFDDLMAREDIDTLIIDELSVFKSPTSGRTKTMRKLAASRRWVWGMTGAPIPNEPTDAWAQATIVTPHSVPKYFGRFRDELMTRITQFKWAPKQDAVEKAFNALQPAVRYVLDDVVELPDCIERTMDIEMGPKQKKVYKSLVDHCHAAIASKEITAANAGAVMMKLLQVAQGWVYSSDKGVVSLDNDERIKALMDIINSADQKLLVFVPFKHSLAGISAALTAEGIEHAEVSGDTSAGKRAEIFSLFQNTDKYRVLVAHPQCLAHGITLTTASTIVWFGPVTSLEIFDQANARIRRVGQKHKQQIIMMQGTPVEKKIYALLQRKQRVQERLLELFEEASE